MLSDNHFTYRLLLVYNCLYIVIVNTLYGWVAHFVFKVRAMQLDRDVKCNGWFGISSPSIICLMYDGSSFRSYNAIFCEYIPFKSLLEYSLFVTKYLNKLSSRLNGQNLADKIVKSIVFNENFELRF